MTLRGGPLIGPWLIVEIEILQVGPGGNGKLVVPLWGRTTNRPMVNSWLGSYGTLKMWYPSRENH